MHFLLLGKNPNAVSLLQVKLGPTFNFDIKGRSSAPRLEFSFTRHNFGKCLVYRPGMAVASTTLVISNTSKKDVGSVLVFFFFTRRTYMWRRRLGSSGQHLG